MDDSTNSWVDQDQADDDPIPPHPDKPYGFMEREVAFKLLASHAMVDKEFFFRLREDPAGAAKDLHIALTEKDLNYLQNVVEWDRVNEHAETIRDALHLEEVTNSW
jgi:hypothetical protein